MGNLRWSRLLLILLFSFALIFHHPDQIQAESLVPQFKPQKCSFTLPDKVRDGEDLLCGYVNVPEDYKKPQGKQIFLAVAIIKSFSQNKDPEPLIYLHGGPGAWLLKFLQYNFGFFQGFSGHRDVILFDQRGVGLSQPALNCPEMLSTSQHSFDETTPKWKIEARSAAATCQQRLLSEGI